MEYKDKLNSYEEFIEWKLKDDLRLAELKINRLREERQHWTDAKLNFKMLKLFKQDCGDQDLQIDVPFAEWDDNRCISASGTVANLSQLHIIIGCGIRLPMDLEDADKYADIRIRAIDRQIKHYMDLAIQIKVRIKVTLLAINEMMLISLPEKASLGQFGVGLS